MFAAQLPAGRATWTWRVQGGGSQKGARHALKFTMDMYMFYKCSQPDQSDCFRYPRVFFIHQSQNF